MPEFEFRLRFHLLGGDRLKADAPVMPLPAPFDHIRLVSWKKDTPIGDSPRLFLVGGPYPSSEAALEAGTKARHALLTWALQRRLPVDLGDGRKRGGLTAAGKQYLSDKLGGPVRDQFHGLDVYERVPGQLFVSTEASAALGIGAESTATRIAEWLANPATMSSKQSLAAELYLASGFDGPFRSRFITLMTAFEALIDHLARPPAVVALVQELEAVVASAAIPHAERTSILSSLKWLHEESIGQAGRRVAATLSGEYGGVPAPKFFTKCYDVRSAIVHSGATPEDVDLLEMANELHRFVGDVLHESIGIVPA